MAIRFGKRNAKPLINQIPLTEEQENIVVVLFRFILIIGVTLISPLIILLSIKPSQPLHGFTVMAKTYESLITGKDNSEY